MDLLIDRVAGLDVHRDTVMACVRSPKPSGRRGRVTETEEFGSVTKELRRLAAWLGQREVTHVAMEATGVYWKPVFGALESRFEVIVVDAAHIKNVPGRKTDVADSAWIAQLLEHGLLAPSYIPPSDIRQLRSLTRFKRSLIHERVRAIQRIEKMLQDAGIKLTSVASTVLSRSGREMIEALIAGQRDPAALAELARGRLRSKIPLLVDALEGRFDSHHAALARQGLAHIDFLDQAVAAIALDIDQLLEPHRWAMDLLDTIPGVNARIAEVIVAEIGVDMSRFPTPGRLASWAGMCPGNAESAGKRGAGTTRPGCRGCVKPSSKHPGPRLAPPTVINAIRVHSRPLKTLTDRRRPQLTNAFHNLDRAVPTFN